MPTFHRICCDQGLFLFSRPRLGSVVFRPFRTNLAPSLVDWLPSQKTHILCLAYQSSHRLPLASPAALLCLLYRCPHPQPWRYLSFYKFWHSCVSKESVFRTLFGASEMSQWIKMLLAPNPNNWNSVPEFNSQWRTERTWLPPPKLSFDFYACMPTHIIQ